MIFSATHLPMHTAKAVIAALLLLSACGQDPETPAESTQPDAALPDLDAGYALSVDQITNAGIQTTIAAGRTLTTTLTLPAMAMEDLDEQSHVNSILPGVVIHVAAELGHEVEQGALMCTIRSATLAQAVANVRLARTVLEASMRMQTRELEILQRVVALAQSTQDREEQMSKEGFGTATDLANAQIALQEAELARDRRDLELEQQIAHQNETLSAALSQLHAWGFDSDFPDSQEASIGLYSLHATKPGVVMERHITEGEFVDAQTQLFLIQGMEVVWMLASVFENQIRFVNEGAGAVVRFNAYPDLAVEGVVDHIHHDLDIDTRSVKARVQVENHTLPGRKDPHPLLPGMYGTITVETGTVDAKIAIPTSVILREGNRDYIFTTDGAGTFQRRFVEIGLRTIDYAEVLSGIEPGEHVLTDGLFILESLLHADVVSEHNH